jgi:drug/metabolite transporter (DMT)-like permease
VSDSRSSSRRPSAGRGAKVGLGPATHTSIVRTAVSALLVLVGIAWNVVYVTVAGPDTDGTSLVWMGDLGRWNYVIGFGLIFVGLALAAHKSTPLGRGRGVVVGMLGCFLLGLLWIVTYYVTGQNANVPLLSDLAQYNLVVGIGFMAVGFVYATHWE